MATPHPAPPDPIDVRYITHDEIPEWSRALDIGFLRPSTEANVEWRRRYVEPERTIGAFEGTRCVGTFRSGPKVVTVPGGATLTSSGVTNVTVTTTHRRRGLLTRMMAEDLRASVERGEPAAVLVAAEYGIYGRYGYGHATTVVTYDIDIPRAALGPYASPSDGRIDLVDGAEVRKYAPEMHDRFRLARVGALHRDESWWQLATGDIRSPVTGWKQPFHALYRDSSGRVDGLLTYTVDDTWEAKRPQVTLSVLDLIATTPAAEAALWRYAMSVDWVVKVTADYRPPDDILPLLLGDPRAAQVTSSADFMWLRLLDIPQTLSMRSYATADSLVIEVHDRSGHAEGRYLLDTPGPSAPASCTRTTRSADLTLDVSALGALYLGDETATRLSSVGHIDEHTPNAATRTDALFHTGRRPWCPDVF
jgi:predicted acetyltransferase